MNEEKKTQKETQVLRTYSSDMADAVRQNEMSIIKIALAEQNRHEREDIYRKAEGTTLQKIFWIVGGILLLLGAGALVYFLVIQKDASITQVEVTKNIDTLISYDSSISIDTTSAFNSTELSNLISNEVKKGDKPGSIKSIFLTESVGEKKETKGIENLLQTLEVTAPGALQRSFESNYMVGSYQPKETLRKPNLFFIFTTNDYPQTFAGMLQWEKTLLVDLFTVFEIDISNDRRELLQKSFRDIIINNKDGRVLVDANNKEVLYYLFVDKNTLIITDAVEALREIQSRLFTKNTKPL